MTASPSPLCAVVGPGWFPNPPPWSGERGRAQECRPLFFGTKCYAWGVIGERTPGEAQTMTAQQVSGTQPFALFCVARGRPARIEAGMTSPV
jgi:hypothetical protein